MKATLNLALGIQTRYTLPMNARIIAIVLGVLVLLLGASLAYGGFAYRTLQTMLAETTSDLASTSEQYSTLTRTATELQVALVAEQAKNGTFESQITKISSTVGTLDKLAKTDKELLAKYSKVYFLSENYIPASLSLVPAGFEYPVGKKLEVHTQVLPHLESLVLAAKRDGVDIRATSGYRSFGSQGALKSNYSVLYGRGANAFSADQGYSEHQLGTTLDFTTEGTKGALVGFESTPAYTWLTKNAYRYGFVLSYPKGNAYYQHEPWHWRYVGRSLSTRLYKDEDYFYELEQREIDTYLVSLFD